MNEKQFIEEVESRIQRVREADTDDFFELVKMLDLNPLTDLAGEELSYISLKGGNLQGANLRHTNFTGSDLTDTNLSNADLRDAKLDRANLSNADLTNADLRGASVEEAIFKNNAGISQLMKLKLSRRGAIFDSYNPPLSSNIIAFNKLIKDAQWFHSHKGQYVALVNGELVDVSQDRQKLLDLLNSEKYRTEERSIEKVEDKGNEKIIDFPIPISREIEFN